MVRYDGVYNFGLHVSKAVNSPGSFKLDQPMFFSKGLLLCAEVQLAQGILLLSGAEPKKNCLFYCSSSLYSPGSHVAPRSI